jgi:hypothetical protein
MDSMEIALQHAQFAMQALGDDMNSDSDSDHDDEKKKKKATHVRNISQEETVTNLTGDKEEEEEGSGAMPHRSSITSIKLSQEAPSSTSSLFSLLARAAAPSPFSSNNTTPVNATNASSFKKSKFSLSHFRDRSAFNSAESILSVESNLKGVNNNAGMEEGTDNISKGNKGNNRQSSEEAVTPVPVTKEVALPRPQNVSTPNMSNTVVVSASTSSSSSSSIVIGERYKLVDLTGNSASKNGKVCTVESIKAKIITVIVEEDGSKFHTKMKNLKPLSSSLLIQPSGGLMMLDTVTEEVQESASMREDAESRHSHNSEVTKEQQPMISLPTPAVATSATSLTPPPAAAAVEVVVTPSPLAMPDATAGPSSKTSSGGGGGGDDNKTKSSKESKISKDSNKLSKTKTNLSERRQSVEAKNKSNKTSSSILVGERYKLVDLTGNSASKNGKVCTVDSIKANIITVIVEEDGSKFHTKMINLKPVSGSSLDKKKKDEAVVGPSAITPPKKNKEHEASLDSSEIEEGEANKPLLEVSVDTALTSKAVTSDDDSDDGLLVQPPVPPLLTADKRRQSIKERVQARRRKEGSQLSGRAEDI